MGVKSTILRQWANLDRRVLAQRMLVLLFILGLALLVRGLTMRFIREHLSDPGWFQSGSYGLFDRQAQAILDGKASVFWLDDPSRTEAAVYPPGYAMWLVFVYTISGERNAAVVQRLQWILDAFSVLLIIGIGVTAYDWSVGIAAGFLGALSPLLALNGATPMADAPTSWIVLAAVWAFLLAVSRQSIGWAICAGSLVGVSCWLRANALLLVAFWLVAVLFLLRGQWRSRLLVGAAIVLGTAIVIAPLLIRNAIAFRAFVPTGLGVGTNLWEGIGETDRATEFGAVSGDQALKEQERAALGVPADVPFGLYHPDGVERDRARTRKALNVIVRNPVWYAGVMAGRMVRMLKYAGKPVPNMGSAGINVTRDKTLPAHLRAGPVAQAVDAVGSLQSVLRWILLPLIAVGLWLARRRDLKITLLLLATVLYYLLSLSFMHSELRYGLPMHALLLVWAGFAIVWLRDTVHARMRRPRFQQSFDES